MIKVLGTPALIRVVFIDHFHRVHMPGLILENDIAEILVCLESVVPYLGQTLTSLNREFQLSLEDEDGRILQNYRIQDCAEGSVINQIFPDPGIAGMTFFYPFKRGFAERLDYLGRFPCFAHEIVIPG
ncbi:MAG: hypothetical protein M1355_03235 [Patescibacteria group bacterium]|nr:hypothetical protein [Patescibacteria group bacterium]